MIGLRKKRKKKFINKVAHIIVEILTHRYFMHNTITYLFDHDCELSTILLYWITHSATVLISNYYFNTPYFALDYCYNISLPYTTLFDYNFRYLINFDTYIRPGNPMNPIYWKTIDSNNIMNSLNYMNNKSPYNPTNNLYPTVMNPFNTINRVIMNPLDLRYLYIMNR